MAKKLILSEEQISSIKNLYLSGIGSKTIAKKMGISIPVILNIIRENGILRNRFYSQDFYSKFWEENNMWCGYWTCSDCKENIKFCVNKKSLLNRNLKRKNVCRKCYSQNQTGSGNVFYGKKHSTEAIVKMLKNQHKVLRPISKPEIEIFNQLTNTGYLVKPQEIFDKPFDFYLPEMNLLIEFNGDYWHCNPEIYAENYFNKKKKMFAKDIWEYDKIKINKAIKDGYNCEIVWEKDYKQNKNIVLEIIKKYEEN